VVAVNGGIGSLTSGRTGAVAATGAVDGWGTEAD